MIDIKCIGKRKKGDSSSTKVVGGGFATSIIKTVEVNGINIWGQYHDHTGDVDGDMMVNGNITATGNISVDNDIDCSQIIATEMVSDNVTTNRLETELAVVNGNATILGTLNGNEADFNEVSATDINGENITAEYLTVTKQAHFFNLTIDEIKSVGGQIILSAANATVDYVYQASGQYVLCWKREDGEDGIGNQFRVNDQVICQTFNKTDMQGQNVSNKYYWGLVTLVGSGSYTVDGVETQCHYIMLSSNTYDGSSVPEVGDKICQLGYRGTDDNARQSAIILSAYKSPDPNVDAPAIVQYAGINSFSLNNCIVNQMSPTANVFTGEFKVISNGQTTDVVDLIQGQHPQVIVDSEQAWIMADSSGKTYYRTDYQNLPTTIQAYLGSTLIPYSEWTTGSQVKFKNQTFRLTGAAPAMITHTGIGISSITRNTNDCTISWSYEANVSINSNTQEQTNNGTTENNTSLEITIVFTHNNITYTVTKNVPFNMIKASAVTQGADAEMDKLMVDKLDLTVTIDNKLTCDVDAKVYHIKGTTISQLTNLADYTASLILSNNQNVSLTKSTYFYKTGNISTSYSSMNNPPTSATLKLYKNNTLVDEVSTAIKFNAGSIFTVKSEAITAAVSQSKSYTDTQISQVELTADGISSRVSAIENDYVTSSELTQTANSIQLNVFDEFKNKTGIDISNSQITLNGNTIVNGTLTLTEEGQGFTLVGDGGITQIMPVSIGSYNNFISLSTTTIPKDETIYGYETQRTGGYQYYRFNLSFNVGTIASGKSITFVSTTDNYYLNNSLVAAGSHTTPNRTITIYEDGTSMASGNFTNSYVYTTSGGNITVNILCYCGIDTSLLSPVNNNNNNNNNTPSELNAPDDVVTEKVHININIPNDTFNLIGYDGIGLNFGRNRHVYIGEECTVLRYGQYGFRFDDSDGVQVYDGTYWYTLDDYITMVAGARRGTS